MVKLEKDSVEALLPNISVLKLSKVFQVSPSTMSRFLSKNNLKTFGQIKRETNKPARLCQSTDCDNTTTNPRFCSKSCSAKTTNKEAPKRLRSTKCTKCDTITKSYRHTLCEEHWSEYKSNRGIALRQLTLKQYWERPSVKNKHPSWKNSHLRGLAKVDFKHLANSPCACCGYTLHTELCHIKAIKDFPESANISEVNSPENIMPLCRNCHWEFDHFDKFNREDLNEQVVVLYEKNN